MKERMYYNAKQLVDVIKHKDLWQGYIQKNISFDTFSEQELYDIVIMSIKSEYFDLAYTLLQRIVKFISGNSELFSKIRQLVATDSILEPLLKQIENQQGEIISSQQHSSFLEFINAHNLQLKAAYKSALKKDLQEYHHQLNFIEEFNPANSNKTQTFLQSYLDIHKSDIWNEREKILNRLIKEGFDTKKQDIYSLEKPTKNLTILFDWTIDSTNKKEYSRYRSKEEILDKDALLDSPYFLYVSNQKTDYFIGKRYYKQAIMSYTSNFARNIRYSNEEGYNYVDMVIQNWIFRKIFIRNAITADFIDVENPWQQEIKKIDKWSWIADISNLLTDYQDLIFRSQLNGLILVEWVAGSGKTNLIFHRIDYLLQEYPQEYRKENIAILVKNIYLKEYLISSLASTEFSFKDDVQVYILHDLINKIISKQTDLDQEINYNDFSKIISKSIIKNKVSEYFRNTLNKSVWELKTKLTVEIFLKVKEYQSTPTVKFSGWEKFVDNELQKCKEAIEESNIDSNISYYENLKNIESMVLSYIQDFQTQGIINAKYLQFLEDGIDEIINKFKLSQNKELMTQSKVNLMKLIDKVQLIDFDYNYISVVYLLQYFFKEVFDRNIMPQYDYLLLDEFQDLQIEELEFLYDFYPDCMVWSWDLTQSSIYHNTDILSRFTIIDRKLIQDNFRNTLQTIQLAHAVLDKCNIYTLKAKKVHRMWQLPLLILSENSNKTFEYINNIIQNSTSGNKKIWIAYLDSTVIDVFVDKLKENKIQVYYDRISRNFWTYHNIFFFHYENIKGLEFDEVILLDIDKLTQNTKSPKLLKYLYVWITRAVNNLYIIADKDYLSILGIEKELYKNSDK